MKFICFKFPTSPFPWMFSLLFIDANMSFGQRLWESTTKALNIISGVTLVLKDWDILMSPMVSGQKDDTRKIFGGPERKGQRVIWSSLNGKAVGRPCAVVSFLTIFVSFLILRFHSDEAWRQPWFIITLNHMHLKSCLCTKLELFPFLFLFPTADFSTCKESSMELFCPRVLSILLPNLWLGGHFGLPICLLIQQWSKFQFLIVYFSEPAIRKMETARTQAQDTFERIKI